jgi:hypothetical protein
MLAGADENLGRLRAAILIAAADVTKGGNPLGRDAIGGIDRRRDRDDA